MNLMYNEKMDHIDLTFIRRLSLRLDKFKEKGVTGATHRFNARCPMCGDSQKSSTKARFWFIDGDKNTGVICYNCNYSNDFQWFLKEYDFNLYKEYRLEKFGAPKRHIEKAPVIKVDKPTFTKKASLSIPKVSTLAPDHSAHIYVADRSIPKDRWHLLYHADEFHKFVKTLLPEHEYRRDEPRLVIPFYDVNKRLIALQGRAYGPSDVKYLTIKIHDVPKIYGQERIDPSRDIIVVEGPIDSLFINNSLAMAGASISELPFPKDKVIFAFDREPRNKEIVNAMAKKIKQGYRVCIADPIPGCKDVNEMVLQDYSQAYIEDDIMKNSHKGLKAEMRLREWSKR